MKILELVVSMETIFPKGLPLWKYDRDDTGILPNIVAQFKSGEMNPQEIRILKAYFQYWINFDWTEDEHGTGNMLRNTLPDIEIYQQLKDWYDRLVLFGVDPIS